MKELMGSKVSYVIDLFQVENGVIYYDQMW